MFKNYFILNRLIIEANQLLKNAEVVSIFSQDKNKLIIECIKNDNNSFIEINVNPGFPYLNIRDSFHRAKKNVVDFFDELLHAKIEKFEIAEFDRTIKIKLSKGYFYFAIRGKFTNIYLMNNNEKNKSFKKEDEKVISDFAEEMNLTKFTDEFLFPDISKINHYSNLEDVRKEFPYIGKEIIKETKRRIGEVPDFQNELIKVIKEIDSENLAVFINKNEYKVNIAPETFDIFSYTEKDITETVTDAFNKFISKGYYLNDFKEKEKLIQKKIERDLKRVSSKLNGVKIQLERGSKEEELEKKANLLLINIHNYKKGYKEVEVDNIYSNNKKIKIKLDEKLAPKENVDKYFTKARGEKKRIEVAEDQFVKLNNEFEKLNKIKERLNNSETREDLLEIMKELNIKKNEQSSTKNDLKSKFKQYIIEGKYNLFVGKDSKNNDLLTTKFAKQNDYWFHARSVPGSHVVLKVDNPKEGIPKNILKKAAAIAAFHSKAKTSGVAPVSYTLKKYVVKRKGMEPGKVALLKEDSILIKPEIPKDCEFITGD